MLSICVFQQFSVAKNDHQIVHASGRYMQVISLRLSYVMLTLTYLLIFQISFGRQNICKYSKLQIVTLALHHVVEPKKTGNCTFIVWLKLARRNMSSWWGLCNLLHNPKYPSILGGKKERSTINGTSTGHTNSLLFNVIWWHKLGSTEAFRIPCG